RRTVRRSCGHLLLVRLGLLAGQRQERVVERRLAQPEVLDDEVLLRERLGETGDRMDAALGRRRDGAVVDGRPARCEAGDDLADRTDVLAPGADDVQLITAGLALEAARITAGDHPA